MIPYTDYECRLKLEDLYEGRSVVLPRNYEHAEIMLRVAQMYIDQEHEKTFNVLKDNHEPRTT